jgi:hypothetical protein
MHTCFPLYMGVWKCWESKIHKVYRFLLFIFQWVASIDLKANDQADANILVKHDENWIEQVRKHHGSCI